MNTRPISINRDEVRGRRVDLDRLPATLESLQHLLAADERHCSRSFAFAGRRNRYASVRASLRLILTGHNGLEPESLRSENQANGKPYLAGDSIPFKLSQSGRLALTSVTRECEVGTDVAENYFAPSERAALRAVPVAERSRGFFRCSTRKEAYLNGHVDGLSIDLHGFAVLLNPRDRAALPKRTAALDVDGASPHVGRLREVFQ